MGFLFKIWTSSVVLSISYIIWQIYVSPLRKFQGPFLAKFTNFWRLMDVAAGRTELTQKALHRQYGVAVRLGPNLISLSDPALIKKIYSIKGDFIKSDFYPVNDVLANGVRIANMFGTKSNEYHNAQVKPIQKYYTMNGVMQCEPLVDRTTERFIHILDTKFVKPSTVLKLDDWLLYSDAWDNIGEITYGAPMGFLEKGGDISGILQDADNSLDYFAIVGQAPWLDNLLAKNPIYPIGQASFGAVVQFSVQRLIERMKPQAATGKDTSQKDYLDYFMEKMGTEPWINDQQVVGWLMVNMMAGADTTAIILRAVFYYVLKQKRIVRRLQAELDAARLTLPISYKSTQNLPYLSAIVLEACRVHPGVGLLLERTIPAEGLTLDDGRYIPGGTTVGMNAWVVHGDQNIYGQDAECFRPERWLQQEDESEGEFEARRKAMRDADLTFGAGNRVCLGKNISILEIYKIVATLFLLYDLELVDAKKDWHVQNSWFVRQSGIDVNIKRRERAF
ncbi:MAG: hypothetical protein GOMPHAMPRED_000275 [Gomphillus americanus]|uniref:Cytochrome P450 n=1 Tax=Gomphillus americanus TaxID=1940652 RepID=A0A8H3I7N0_9LECA|nr:MAG: hypothetical protein GOMPHAMPRED_000275 [Gomphillus americanus]